MANKISRRTFIKRIVGSSLALSGLGLGGHYYAKEIEPNLLDITYHTIYDISLPDGFNEFKVVQFSDTHLGFQYNLNQLDDLIRKINNLSPDIIVFTGDLMDAPNMYPYTEQIVPLLYRLESRFGKFSIYGNHDHGGYGSDIYRKVMENSGFTLLLNTSKKIELLDNSRIWIVGIDDAMLGLPDFSTALKGIPNEDFKLLLSHAPDLADQASHFGINLQLSGHSHGGQIKIPFLGPLVTPPFAEKYREGLYKVGTPSKPLTLYVNRGLGTTRLPFRFLSQPELTVFTLKRQK